MSDFPDDLTVDHDNDSDLVRQLRKQLREKDGVVKTLTKEVEGYRGEKKATSVGDLLKAKGVDPKVAKLVLKDVDDPTEESVGKWLDEWADVLNIRRAEGEGESQPQATAQEPGESTGLSAEDAAAFRTAQTTESGGRPNAAVGSEKVRQELSDIKALSPEKAYERLRELGLMS